MSSMLRVIQQRCAFHKPLISKPIYSYALPQSELLGNGAITPSTSQTAHRTTAGRSTQTQGAQPQESRVASAKSSRACAESTSGLSAQNGTASGQHLWRDCRGRLEHQG